MIKYTLKCACDHQFESWFQSAAAFDKLSGAGMVTCAVCGSSAVEKAMMAPRVRTGRKAASQLGEAEVQTPSEPAQTPKESPPEPETALAQTEAEAALRKIREKVEANSDYVGSNFVEEARAMHQGEAPERSIYGEAKPAEAKELIEEGVPVLPLPFVPGRKTN
ncbi:DUF1178 family protein [Epibacterium sp. SM1969]|uniref:DUF1178 family protein n=1 Tax=Tritonibacter aquimaris TaxID=2663379 RepID=A0A844AUL5_9RHOB|nr:DUF1178 family protein [Tritonibacter aquimaris]MQY43128.1 DUF1178 family protein [Tritonibacter aquimaris]